MEVYNNTPVYRKSGDASHYLWYGIFILWGLFMMDVITTEVILSFGGYEMNSLMKMVVSSVPLHAALKMAVLSLIAVVAYVSSNPDAPDNSLTPVIDQNHSFLYPLYPRCRELSANIFHTGGQSGIIMPEKTFSLSAHIFTRDLRIDDNPPLLSALASSESVITFFAAEKNLATENPALCENRLAFLSESLSDLSGAIAEKGGELRFYDEGALKLAEKLCRTGVEAVYMTRDYTPYAIKRENSLKKTCNDAGCSFFPCRELSSTNPKT